MQTTHHGPEKEVLYRLKTHNINKNVLFSSFIRYGHVAFWVELRGASQPFVVFQMILTLANSAHKFVILSVLLRAWQMI
jgi:hypothetical protein